MARPSPIAAIVGPTGSGKTELALALAGRLAVEILVADSRQVYRGMDIGTAKPDAAARAAVPHHLIDLVMPGEPFSVAAWAAAARRLVPEIDARGRLPLLVGGSGLYLAALLDGYAFGAPPPPGLRGQLQDEMAAAGVGALADRLRSIDPSGAAHTDLRNPRRVERAIERAIAGRGGEGPPSVAWPGSVAVLGISRPNEVLNRRIDERARWLFANGLLDEVRALLGAGHDPRHAPLTSHGYGEAARYLAGEWSLDEAVEVTARRTRQYAKRQRTWFRRDHRVAWLEAGDGAADDPSLVEAAERILLTLRGSAT
ncbi:MAG TPA: tRNA (adenosine(37)-N6)-dimethylallyltransferase MiaA [Candidatus Limnocylindria bacterium]|nr:tRNA (adenosine(37)-N6)-dimethylallyltransferase MiaA [Candidatus Limnocylindria bacterium]